MTGGEEPEPSQRTESEKPTKTHAAETLKESLNKRITQSYNLRTTKKRVKTMNEELRSALVSGLIELTGALVATATLFITIVAFQATTAQAEPPIAVVEIVESEIEIEYVNFSE